MKKYFLRAALSFAFAIATALLFAFLGKAFLEDSFALEIATLALMIFSGVLLAAFLVNLIAKAIKKRKDFRSDPEEVYVGIVGKSDFARRNTARFFKRVCRMNAVAHLYLILCEACIYACFILASFLAFIYPITLIVVVLTSDVIIAGVNYFLIKDDFYSPDIEIKKSEFPRLYALIEGVMIAFGIKNANFFISFGSDIDFFKSEGKYELHLGITAYQILNDDELKAALYRQILLKKGEKTEKILKTNAYLDRYEFILSKASFSARVFGLAITNQSENMYCDKIFIERECSSITDKLMARTPYSKAYAQAYKKCKLYESFVNDERCNLNKRLFASSLNAADYGTFILDEFFIFYGLYGNEWEKEIERKLASEIPTERTFEEKISDLNVKADDIAIIFDDHKSDEYNNILSMVNSLNYEYVKEEYEIRKENYEYVLTKIARYESDKKSFTERRALLNIAECYKIAGAFEESVKIYNQLSENGCNSSEFLYEKGLTLLTLKDDTGIDCLLQAMSNDNYTERALTALGDYISKSGNVKKYSEFKLLEHEKMRKLVTKKKRDEFSVHRGLVETEIGSDTLSEIVGFAVKDENVHSVYISDMIAKNGKRVTVLGFKARNIEKTALYESYQRLFSFLDNDCGQLDTVLIMIDNDAVFLKKFLKEKTSLKFERDE